MASGGDVAEAMKKSFVISMLAFLDGYATNKTDNLKYKACAADPENQRCVLDERGVLRTDGTRGVDWAYNPTKEANWLTKSGMDPEGFGTHWYE